VQQRRFSRAQSRSLVDTTLIARNSRASKAHILSMFLAMRRESRAAHSEIVACKSFSSFCVLVDPQDVVSITHGHAPSCENALIFFLLV
jgi:hypothetical protein